MKVTQDARDYPSSLMTAIPGQLISFIPISKLLAPKLAQNFFAIDVTSSGVASNHRAPK